MNLLHFLHSFYSPLHQNGHSLGILQVFSVSTTLVGFLEKSLKKSVTFPTPCCPQCLSAPPALNILSIILAKLSLLMSSCIYPGECFCPIFPCLFSNFEPTYCSLNSVLRWAQKIMNLELSRIFFLV